MNYGQRAAGKHRPGSFPIDERQSGDRSGDAAGSGTPTCQIAGSVQFAGRRAVGLRLNGAMDVRLISGFVPNLDARGSRANQRFVRRDTGNGRASPAACTSKNASARAADFPTGLSAIKGDVGNSMRRDCTSKI